MGGKLVSDGVKALNESGIPAFSYPDTAARVFDYMWRYSCNLRGIYETPSISEEVAERDPAGQDVERLLESVRRKGRTILTEVESKQVLTRYGIPTVETRVAKSEAEAVVLAREIGFPAVLKVFSETITHKTDVGGVKLNLINERAVARAYREIEASVCERASAAQFQGVTVQPMVRLDGYELILGSSVDPQFGPVVLFGSGGQLVEVYRDRALALPPLNATLAQRLMEQTLVYKAFQGVRGRKAVNVEELKRILVHFSRLVVEQPWIKEIDVNPLVASPERILALDARVVIHPPETKPEALPRTAIRPYPMQYVSGFKMKNGAAVMIRPIRPEDEPLMVKFHGTLSDETVYLRYFHMEKLSSRVAHERLIQKCFIDYDREMALVVDRQVAVSNDRKATAGEHELLAIGRLTRAPGTDGAEVAVLVNDASQKQGLGAELLRRLITWARDEKLAWILAAILQENEGMMALARRFHFEIRSSGDPSVVNAVLGL